MRWSTKRKEIVERGSEPNPSHDCGYLKVTDK